MIETQEFLTVRNEVPNEISFGTLLNINTNKVTEFTHGFHKYPAKFIPQIPRWALDRYIGKNKNKFILDPFSGSGTTAVEALLSGNNAYGIDIDPLSCLISKVKTTKLSHNLINSTFDFVFDELNNDFQPLFQPACETINHWFREDYIKILAQFRDIINSIEDKDAKDLLMICFSSILRRVSNADNESQKAYVSHTKIKTPEDPKTLFLFQLNYYRDRITEFSNQINDDLKSRIINGSCVDGIEVLVESQSFDLAITSPPYIKAIDYIYNQMVELFWVGDLFSLDTQTKQNEKKKQYIGTKHIHKKDFAEYSPFSEKINIPELDLKLQYIYENDKVNGHKHAFVTYKYFIEMEEHFVELNKVLKKNAHYVLVVGDSTVSDIYFETADFLVELAKRNGFNLSNRWGYKIKNRYMRFDRKGRGGIIDIDWVLDFIKV